MIEQIYVAVGVIALIYYLFKRKRAEPPSVELQPLEPPDDIIMLTSPIEDYMHVDEPMADAMDIESSETSSEDFMLQLSDYDADIDTDMSAD